MGHDGAAGSGQWHHGPVLVVCTRGRTSSSLTLLLSLLLLLLLLLLAADAVGAVG